MLKFEIGNPDEIKKFLFAQSGGMKKVSERATADMVFAAATYAKEQAIIEPKRRTRLYWGSIHAEMKKEKGFIISGVVASNVAYAPALEEGTKPHDIYPVNKKALAFGSIGNKFRVVGGVVKHGKSLGKIIRKHVRHPGTKAYHVLGNAAKRAVSQAQIFVNRAMAFFEAKKND